MSGFKVDSQQPTFPHHPAFPCRDSRGYYSGISVRDYFASVAIQGLCSEGLKFYGETPEKISKRAVDIADALIAELNKGRGK